jgi:tetratricopeptide (TPR) repeat protein
VERNNVFSKSYHNTTARYNGYFLAKEKMKELDLEVKTSYKEDYNKVLPIYYPITAKSKTTITPMVEDIIKKASIPIQRHKNSRWIEESYILIARARYFKQDYGNAIDTYKYVNTVSKNDKDRHTALTQLLLTFIADNQLNNATAVVDYLNKERVTGRNRAPFFKAKAYYFFIRGDYPRCILNLRRAEYFTWNGDEKARLHFIIAQLYQETGKPNAAYVHYKLCLRQGPSYELGFYAKLYMAQNLEQERAQDAKKIERNFRKLLKDRKNLEYRDKIYYEMARFELKRDQVPSAMQYLRKSLDISSNPIQKGYSYLLSGIVSYDKLRAFEQAKYYYDSAVNTLDNGLPEYPEILKRQKILDEFVTQLKIIRKEDSVLRLSKMDTISLNELISKRIAEEQEKARKQDLLKQKQARAERINNSGSPTLPSPGGQSGGGFYFSDPGQVARGKSEFTQRWGNRPLEDNWRRSNKDKVFGEEVGEKGVEAKEDGEEDNEVAGSDPKRDQKTDMDKLAASVRKQILKDIPRDEAAVEESKNKLKKALYTIGKIYDQKLKEPDNAILRFEELLERFPDYEKEDEVMYYLFILYQRRGSPKSEHYKRELMRKYKNSSYTMRAINPNYTEESKAINDVVRRVYREAYELHQSGYYQKSDSLALHTLQTYPINDYKDKLTLLRILNTAKLKGPVAYKTELIAFAEDFKSSELVPYSKELIRLCDEYMEAQISGKSKNKAPSETKDGPYKLLPADPHFVIVAYSNKSLSVASQINEIARFNDRNMASEQFQINQFILNDVYTMVVIKQFEGKEPSLRYLNQIKTLDSPLKTLKDSDYVLFCIAEANFFTLFKLKRIDEYLDFFKSSYGVN